MRRGQAIHLVWGVSILSCGHGAATRSPQDEQERRLAFEEPLRALTEPCPASAPASSGAAAIEPGGVPAFPVPTPQVFVEAAIFEVGAAMPGITPARALEYLDHDPSARFMGGPQLIGKVGQRVRVTLEERTLPLEASVLHELSLNAQLPEPTLPVIELEVVLQLPAASSAPLPGVAPRETRVQTTFAQRERQTSALTLPIPGRPGRWLLVVARPYIIRSEADLYQIFQCKVAHRAR